MPELRPRWAIILDELIEMAEREGENGERKTEKTRSSRLPSANYIMLAIKNKSCVHINYGGS